MKKCDICGSDSYPNFASYNSKDGVEIPNVATYVCINVECRHTWLPNEEEARIDKALGIEFCKICTKQMDTQDPLRKNLGGDCLECMADIVEDPDAIAEVEEIRRGQ